MNSTVPDGSDRGDRGGRPRVVIIGGGLAGMAAAWALADAPVQVTLLESRRRAGGRAGSFFDSASGQWVDYCQHVAMGCCTNFLQLMQQTGLASQFLRTSTLTFHAPQVPPSRLAAAAWLPAPLHLAPSLGRLAALTPGQRREVRRGIWRLMRTRATGQATFAQWLQQAGQSTDTIDRFWNVVIASALGEQADRVAVAPARKVFVDGFLAARGAADVVVPQTALAELFGQRLPDALRRRGVEVRVGAAAHALQDRDGRPAAVCLADGQRIAGDHFIAAVPWHALPRLVQHSVSQQAIDGIDAIGRLPASPITGMHLWVDRPLIDGDHAVLVGGLGQWLFRRPSDPQPPVAQPAEPAAGHYFQVVISASRDVRQMPQHQAVQQVMDELRGLLPAAAAARLLHWRVVTDPQAVFSVDPHTESIRPPTATRLANFHLAGDYTQTGWPATMEGAVISGLRAAARVMTALGQPRTFECPPLPHGWLARLLIRPALA